MMAKSRPCAECGIKTMDTRQTPVRLLCPSCAFRAKKLAQQAAVDAGGGDVQDGGSWS